MTKLKELFTFKKLKKFIIINLGVFIVAAGLHFFLVPDNLAAGGTSGLAVLISAAFPSISVSGILFIINALLLILGFITIGRVFGAYTIYSTFAMSIFLKFLEAIYPISKPLTDDVFINLFFGVLIQAIGIAFVLNEGASTGGTDIIGMMFKKYTHLSFGTGLAISDGLITLGALMIHGPKIGMYSLFGVFINSIIVDKILAGFDSKFNITISSDKLDEINNFILTDLFRGSTLYDAVGGYSNEDRRILTTIVSRKDYIKLKNFIAEIDPEAFVYISHVNEVTGLGFTF